VDDGALRGVVTEVALGDADSARDGGGVDDCAGPAVGVLCGFLEEREEGDAKEERCDGVSRVD